MSATTGPNLIRSSITRLWYLNIFSQKPFNTNTLAVELLKTIYVIENFLVLQRYRRSWIRNSVLRKIISKVALRTTEPATFRLINYRLYTNDGDLSFFGNYTWRNSMSPTLPSTLNKDIGRINVYAIERKLKKLKETRYINNQFLFKNIIFDLASTRKYSKFLSQKYITEIFNMLTTLEPYVEPVEGEEVNEEVEIDREFYSQLLSEPEPEYDEQRELLEKFGRFGENIFQINKKFTRRTLRYYKQKNLRLPKKNWLKRLKKNRAKKNKTYTTLAHKFAHKKGSKQRLLKLHFIGTSCYRRLKLFRKAFRPKYLSLNRNRKNTFQHYKNALKFKISGPRDSINFILTFWYTQIFNKLFSLKINNFLSGLGYHQLNDINFQNQFIIPRALDLTTVLRKKLYAYRFNVPKNNSFKNLLNLIPAVLNFQAMHLLARQTAVELSKTKQHKRIIFLLQTILTVSYMQFRAQPLNAKAGLSGLTIRVVGRPQKSDRTKTMIFNFGQTPLSSFKKNTVTKSTAVANAQIGTFSITITTVG